MQEPIEEFFLNPGELIFSKWPVIIKTVLGSCIAVCVYDKVNQFGGMCHYLLPHAHENSHSTKYGDVAIKVLLQKFMQAGSKREYLEASVIGGAFIIFDDREVFFIGDNNAEVAMDMLRNYKIRVKIVNTGGEKGKKVLFNTLTNQILVQNLESMHLEDLYQDKKT